MDQLIVALDVETAAEARHMVDMLHDVAGAFKIGLRLFASEGPALVEDLVARGNRVFLDLKFHDIPNTVAGAIDAVARLGVWMVDVHASGGIDMMRAARQAADDGAARANLPRPLVTAVTVLTSLDQARLEDVGVAKPITSHVEHLAMLARAAGLDGVVASPREIRTIRASCGDRFAIVTPGIRSTSDPKGDQQRTASASGAVAAGASYIVVGRPIIAAGDPRAAAERIVAECAGIR